MNPSLRPFVLALGLSLLPVCAGAQALDIPDWALPGSATHHQVPPPAGFHRDTRTSETPVGIFDGQSDVGGAVLEGSGTFDQASGKYTVISAGYNIWYFRDEFRFLWKKMSGDVSLAATISFPNAAGYGDRKAVFMIRQNLDDDSKEVMTALHGAGLIHLAQRPEKAADIKEAFKVQTKPQAGAPLPRIGLEKHGDLFALFVSVNGEPMHQQGPATELKLKEPFYVGIGFTSHQPGTLDSAVLSDVVLENSAGKVR
ncbi:MAG TPA: hypothetical protein VFE25_00050 [Opitutaceae bacterium]|jgi:hypothetical protein|nr:hypothetical protein [Opitutaceae bacterium]